VVFGNKFDLQDILLLHLINLVKDLLLLPSYLKIKKNIISFKKCKETLIWHKKNNNHRLTHCILWLLQQYDVKFQVTMSELEKIANFRNNSKKISLVLKNAKKL
jgi:hypothetical protein